MLKKPSKSYCSVCPSKIGKSTTEQEEVPPTSRPPQKKRPINTKRHTRTNNHSSKRVMRKVRHTKKVHRTKKKPMRRIPISTHRRPSVRPPTVKKNTALRSNNHYYGVDHNSEVPRPLEGDTFRNTVNGDFFLYKRDMWNLIPVGSYFGESSSIQEIMEKPNEGDLYFSSDKKIVKIFQEGDWHQLENLKNDHQDINQENQNDILNNIIKDQRIRSNQTRLITQKKSFQYDWQECQIVGEYQNLSQENLKKLKPDINPDVIAFQVVPQGFIDINMIINKKGQKSIKLSIESWIRYSDSESQIWQTVTCLSNIELYDDQNNLINDYTINGQHMSKLVDLQQSLKSITTTANNDNIIFESKNQNIGKIKWVSQLLAYPIVKKESKPEDFFIVKFQNMSHPIALPKVKISFSNNK